MKVVRVMAVYYIEQHLLLARVRTVIKDCDGKPVFLLVGSWGTRGDSISIYQLDGEVLASAKQTAFSYKSRFDLYDRYEKVGSLSRLFSVSRDFYFIKKLHWLATGDIKNQTYKLYHFNDKVMEMTKETSYRGDFYRIDVSKEANAPLCICIASVLDYWARRESKADELITKKSVNLQLG